MEQWEPTPLSAVPGELVYFAIWPLHLFSIKYKLKENTNGLYTLARSININKTEIIFFRISMVLLDYGADCNQNTTAFDVRYRISISEGTRRMCKSRCILQIGVHARIA